MVGYVDDDRWGFGSPEGGVCEGAEDGEEEGDVLFEVRV